MVVIVLSKLRTFTVFSVTSITVPSAPYFGMVIQSPTFSILLANYVDETEKVVEEYNKEHDIDNSVLVNGRRQTNLGVFRAYLTNYLRSLPTVNQDMTCMVRQLQPTETGIPLELYFFSANKVWVAYEGIQADVFDHVLAIIPEFGLRVFQNPSGEDLRRIGVKIEH